jgi:hypothetical protein
VPFSLNITSANNFRHKIIQCTLTSHSANSLKPLNSSPRPKSKSNDTIHCQIGSPLCQRDEDNPSSFPLAFFRFGVQIERQVSDSIAYLQVVLAIEIASTACARQRTSFQRRSIILRLSTSTACAR